MNLIDQPVANQLVSLYQFYQTFLADLTEEQKLKVIGEAYSLLMDQPESSAASALTVVHKQVEIPTSIK